MATHRLNSMEVKKMNRNAIYRYLYHRESTSIQEIAQALGLSLPTVTQNLKELQERGLIEETGLYQSTGGVRPSQWPVTVWRDMPSDWTLP